MSEHFPTDDTGTEARARRDEIEGLLTIGVDSKALMNASQISAQETTSFDHHLGEPRANEVMGEIIRFGKPVVALSERELAVFKHFYPEVNLDDEVQETA